LHRGHALRIARAPHTLGLDFVARLAQPRGVHQRQRQAFNVDPLGQQVARGAGNIRHDRARRAGQRVKKA